jgi:glycogen debranching enzyme
VSSHQVRLLNGSTFVVSDRAGDVGGSHQLDGLFYRDVRHLSQWQVLVDGRPMRPVAAHELEYDSAVFYAVEPVHAMRGSGDLTLLRERRLGSTMWERLTLTNVGHSERRVTVTLRFDADFADLYQVRERITRTARTDRRLAGDDVTLHYERDGYGRATRVRAPGAFLTGDSATFTLVVAAGGHWAVELEISLSHQSEQSRAGRNPHMDIDLAGWLDAMPRLQTDWQALWECYHRSLVDLAALRFYPDVVPRASLLAAGLPWFMTLFGRDSLIACYEALPFVPELCRTTLRALAGMQAKHFDDRRDAEPGKIMHELRHGELVYFGERPQSPYYGTCDATPLFLIVLDEYERWTGDVTTVRDLEGAARAALDWIEHHGDLDGDGYLEYQTRNPEHGLTNQCWKDSPDSIVHPDGRLASLPRATCEIQGYAYDARLRMARLARLVWDDAALADRLERDAAALREAFNRDFWLPEQDCYALALDGQKRPVATVASNMGHLLWSGIVPDARVDAVVGQLMGDRMFSGWGIRTVAAGQPAFNPLGYHIGTVWPHDNAIIAAGLLRYGRRAEASRIAGSILETAPTFNSRLPETFAGEGRGRIDVPLPYPDANSPQAWAAAAPLLLIRVMLGLDPAERGPSVSPYLPPQVRHLALHRVPGRWGRADAAAPTDREDQPNR